MNTQIYYFSGTGNSLSVAKRIQEKFGNATLIKITAALRANPPTIAAEVVGFVFPVYAWGPPKIVAQFLQRATISQPQYLFLCATHGSGPENAIQVAKRILTRKGLAVHGAFDMEMVGNYIVGFNPPTSEQAQAQLQQHEPEIAQIVEKIANRQAYAGRSAATFSGKFKSAVIHPLFTLGAPKQGKKFSATEACTGCGVCAKVCPVNNITLNSAKQPVWGAQCEFCLACINWCPAQAIESGNATPGRNRYHHPDIQASEF